MNSLKSVQQTFQMYFNGSQNANINFNFIFKFIEKCFYSKLLNFYGSKNFKKFLFITSCVNGVNTYICTNVPKIIFFLLNLLISLSFQDCLQKVILFSIYDFIWNKKFYIFTLNFCSMI